MELLTKLIAEMRLDARIMLYWHGTTDLNVNTILSQGLSQGIGPDVWGETEAPPLPTNQDTSSMSNYRYDLNQHIYDELRRSYGGTYFTQRWSSAFVHARRACRRGGSPLLVAAYLEPRSQSVLMDEDTLPVPSYAFRESGVSTQTPVHMVSWIVNGYQGLDQIVDSYLRLFEDDRRNVPGITTRRINYARDKARDLVLVWHEREIAILLSTQQIDSWQRSFIESNMPEVLNWNWKEKDNQYRTVVDSFMRSTGWAANLESDMIEANVRVVEPVTYSGKNKIVLVARFLGENKEEEDPDFSVPEATFELVYGSNAEAIESLRSGARTLFRSVQVTTGPANPRTELRSAITSLRRISSVTYSPDVGPTTGTRLDVDTAVRQLATEVFAQAPTARGSVDWRTSGVDWSSTEYRDTTGTGNIYPAEGRDEFFVERVVPLFESVVESWRAKGWDMETRLDTSGMTQGPVLRVVVRSNPSEDVEEPPRLNVANHTAAKLAELLGLGDPWGGEIGVAELRRALLGARNRAGALDPYLEEPREEGGDDGARSFSMGYDEARLSRYLDALEQVATWASARGIATISWG